MYNVLKQYPNIPFSLQLYLYSVRTYPEVRSKSRKSGNRTEKTFARSWFADGLNLGLYRNQPVVGRGQVFKLLYLEGNRETLAMSQAGEVYDRIFIKGIKYGKAF